jgi:cytochrome c-type biogenesis protein CcmH/NrfG
MCGTIQQTSPTEKLTINKKRVRSNPDDASARYLLGRNYGELGRYQDAIASYREAILIQNKLEQNIAQTKHALPVSQAPQPKEKE